MRELVRVLLVEDNPGDADLIAEYLGEAEGLRIELDRVERVEDAASALEADSYAVILLDLSLPDSQGLDTLRRVRSAYDLALVIVLTGHADEQLAWAAVSEGADDYLLKSHLSPSLLERSIRYAVERARAAAVLRRQEHWYRALVENNLSDVVGVVDRNAVFKYVSPAAARVLGHDPEYLLGRALFDQIHEDDQEKVREALEQLSKPASVVDVRLRVLHKDGGWRTMAGMAVNMLDDPFVDGIVITVHDLTSMEERQAQLERRTRDLGERVKEQRCIYTVLTHLHGVRADLQEAFQRVVDAIPAGMQYPGLVAAELRLGEGCWTTGQGDPRWRLEVPIEESGETTGSLSVAFTEEPPQPDRPFLDEEAMLLRAIADAVVEARRLESADAALRRSEVYFRTITESSTDLIAVVSGDGQIRYMSPSVEHVLGIPRRAGGNFFTGDPSFLHPSDSRRLRQLFDSLAREPGGVRHSEVRVRSNDRWRTLEFDARNMLDNPDVGGIVFSARDVTERKAADERIRFQAKLLDAVGQAVVVEDHRGEIVYFNRAAELLHGRSVSEVTGRSVSELVEQDKAEAAAMRVALESNGWWQGESHLRRKDGSTVPILCTRTLFRDEEGRVVGTIAVATDLTAQKEVESALRQSEERFQTVALAGRDVHFEYNASTGQLWWSDGLATFGYESGGEPSHFADWVELIHPEDRDEVLSVIEGANADHGQQSWTGDYRLRRANGSYATVYSRVRFQRDEAGEMVGVVGALMDMTEQRRLEQERQRSEEKYRTLFDSMRQGVVYHSADGSIMAANAAAERILGLTAEQLVGQKSTDYQWRSVRPDGSELPGMEHPSMVAVRTGEPVHDVLMGVYHPEQDRPRWIEIDARPQFRPGEERPFQVYTIFEDVTDRLDAEEAVRRKDAILEAVSFVAARFLRQGELDRHLPEALEALGSATGSDTVQIHERIEAGEGSEESEGENRLRHRWSAVGERPDAPEPEPLVRNIARWERILSERGFVHGPTAAFPADERAALEAADIRAIAVIPIFVGDERWGSITYIDRERGRGWTAPELDALRTAAATLGAALERRRTEAALQERDEQLQQSLKMEAVGRLAGGVAHDFNNLLTAITGHSEFLAGELESGSSLRNELSEIQRAAQRATALTRQLLAFSRKQVVVKRVLDLGSVVKETESLLRRVIGENIQITTRAEEGAHVLADPNQMEQVILNLSVNARDAMPGGGSLDIAVRRVEINPDSIPARALPRPPEPGSYTVLEVRDTGTGIDEETRSHIFEPFFTTKSSEQGTGLGLATVYGIVERAGGCIDVETRLHQGTTFRVLLPWVDAPKDAGAGETARPDHGRVEDGNETILVVEDEDAVRRVAVRSLARRGYTVLEAASGAEALEIAGRNEGRIDLVLSDVVMPDMNGPELSAALRFQFPHLRILLTSGYTDDDIGALELDGYRPAFLEKPYSPTSLAAKVRDVLDKQPG